MFIRNRLTAVAALFVLQFSVIFAAFAQTGMAAVASSSADSTVPLILSPRLRSLVSDFEKTGPATLDRFWYEIAENGTPLIEPIAGETRFLYVTFLWKGTTETRNVVVLTLGNNQLGSPGYFAHAQLAHLPNTNVWYRTYRLRNDARFSYRMAENDSLQVLTDFNLDPQRAAAFKPDPLNSRHYTNVFGENSVVELPNAPAQPWTERLPGVPEGKLESFPLHSGILNNDRKIWVYTPAGFTTKKKYDLLVRLGDEFTDLPIPTILNNLIGKGKIPPTVAVFIGNAEDARIKEYWYDDQFAEFVARELMPWVRARYRVTTDPRRTIVAGSSLGGGTAIFLAMLHPELFGNVVAQSGGYMYPRHREDVARPAAPGQLMPDDFPENEWLAHELATRAKLPLRIYLEAGALEDVVWERSPPRYAYPSLLVAARHLRDVLLAKGYDLTYYEYNGAHEPMGRRGSFADALIALAGK